MYLERVIVDFLGTDSSIIYSQGFSTMPCAIPALAKRGDINFTIQRGLQISGCTVRWFDHNNLKSLEDVLLSVERNSGNAADLFRDDSSLPRAFLRRAALWLIYQSS